MKLRHFISGSSVLLLAWLGVTFVYHAPTPRYQKSETTPATAVMLPDQDTATIEISAVSARVSAAN